MNKNSIPAIQALVSGASFVTASTVTETSLLRKDQVTKEPNPYAKGQIVTMQRLNGSIGFDYEKCVNRLAGKEGQEAREAKPRNWGVLTEDRLFVEHKGEYYLRLKVEKSLDKIYVDSETGEEIALEKIKRFMSVKKKSSTQSDLEGEVIERDVKFCNIKELKIRGLSIT
jgi:hypothetical protein